MTRLPLRLDYAIGEIAAQYHRRVRLRGLLWFGAAFLALLVGLGASVRLLWETPVPLVAPLVAFFALLSLAGHRWLYRVRRHAVSRQEIARFIDAHHPELEDLVLSSVAFGETDAPQASAWMVAQVLSRAREVSAGVRLPALFDTGDLGRLRRASMLVLGAGAVGLAVLLLTADWTWIGHRLFFAPAPGALPFEVAPGHIRVRVGASQRVWVTTDRASAQKAIRWRTGQGQWQTGVLEPGQADGVYAFSLHNLAMDTEYQVQVGALRSEVYRIAVWTPPDVVSIGVTYRYPAYLDMPERHVPHGGDIAAPEGTGVVLDVAVNKALARAELVLDSGIIAVLERADALLWRGRLTVVKNDRYRVALQDVEGEGNAYAQPYQIAAQQDRPPEVRIRFPRGDDEATALEEVAFGYQIKDDFGLVDYGFQYAISGRDPVRISLKKEPGRAEKAEGQYALALSDLKVAAGDFLTWTFWASDGKPGRAEVEGLGDPYFLEVRPFARYYRQAVSNEGGQMGGQGGNAADQKQIMIAIWNLRKAAPGLSPWEFERQVQVISEAQREVGAQAGEDSGDVRRAIASVLEALAQAGMPEPDAALARAMGHAQQVHRLLLQRAPNEAQVAQSRGARGGGGGGKARQRELDGLEISRRRDFREEATTLQTQLEETAQARTHLDDLARRQAAINEDMAKLISEMETMTPAEREEAKRQLAQLQEEQRRTMADLDVASGQIASGNMAPEQARQARQQLDAARQQMDRSARNLAGEQVQQARAAGNRALDALRDAQDQLTHLSRDAAAQRMRGLQAAMDSLRAQQARIEADIEAQQAARRSRSLDGADRGGRELAEDQQALSESFRQFMDDAGDLAEKAGQSQGLMAQKLGDWLRETSREGVYEAMQAGQGLVRRGQWERAAEHAQGVGARLDSAAARLVGVADHLVRDDLEAMGQALQRVERVLADGERMDRSGSDSYRNWGDDLREAEALLPGNSETGRRLAGVREGLWGIGQRAQRDAAPPQYDVVYDAAIKPLKLAAQALREAIRARRDAYGFAADQADAVPESYRSNVATYFKALAEMEKE